MNRLKKHLNDKRGDAYTDLVVHTFALDNNVLEPNRSTRDLSVREMRKRTPHHIEHRFPFRGGKSMRDMLIENIKSHNVLLERLTKTKASDEQEHG